MLTIRETLELAIEYQARGQAPQAAAYYEAILRVDPSQPDALHLLGLVASQSQKYPQAEQYLRRAISAAPQCAMFYGNLGVVLRQAGKIDEAIEAYKTSIAIDSTSADMYYNLGRAYQLKGEPEAAEGAFRKSLELTPENVPTKLCLMEALVGQNRLPEAIEIGQAGLINGPEDYPMHMQLGRLSYRINRIEQALEHYRSAVHLQPENVTALCRLATVLLNSNRIDECDYFLNRARALEPKSKYVLTTLGLRSAATGHLPAAINHLRNTIALYPDYEVAHLHLGETFNKAGRFTEALAEFEQACQFELTKAEAMANKAAALMNLGRLEEAEQCYCQALEKRSWFRESHSNLLRCMQYSTGTTAATILREHVEWNDVHAAGMAQPADFTDQLRTKRTLRVGFISSDLGQHPVGRFLVRFFEALDPTQMETIVYSDRPLMDDISIRIRRAVTCWNNVADSCDQALTDQVREDEIDILFDLAGHTAGNRLMVFARRAAPVQISWTGYVGTTGMAEMDYLLADHYHVPNGSEHFYREKILRMPHGYVVYDPPTDAPPVNTLPALSRGFVTYGAASNPAKVNSEVLESWRSILDRVPRSRLTLCYTGWLDSSNQRRVVEALGANEPDRIQFCSPTNTTDVLRWYQTVDIALDTFPYSGGLTTCEAMWMGVPTVTLVGERFASRHSYSHLSNVGLTEGIAHGRDEYVEKAIDLAAELPRVKQLRSNLRDRMENSPLCRGPMFAQAFTVLMRRVWQERVMASAKRYECKQF